MSNVKQTVPFLNVSDMKASEKFYVEALGFEIKYRWEPGGELRWCWLQLDSAAIMMQEIKGTLPANANAGISVYFICEDAITIYNELRSRSVNASRPFVGNSMWVTKVIDPDGYEIYFESMTTDAEGTEYQEH